jgi:hypothetical protein
MAPHQIFKGLYQVLDQMKSIRDLNCLWGAFGGAIRIRQGSVTGDHFHFRMRLQPALERRSFAIRQQIDHTALFQIHQNRPVSLSLAEGKIIYAENANLLCFAGGFAIYPAQ